MRTKSRVPRSFTTDPFLVAIVAGIVVLLAIGCLSLVVLRQASHEYPANTPEGTVQRFYVALNNRDYDTAYSLLSNTMVQKLTRQDFEANAQFVSFSLQGKIRIEHTTNTPDSATITVEVTYPSSSFLFTNSDFSMTYLFWLMRINGQWRITDLPPEFMPYEK